MVAGLKIRWSYQGPNPRHPMSRHDTMDVLAEFAVIAAMVLFFATAGALVKWLGHDMARSS